MREALFPSVEVCVSCHKVIPDDAEVYLCGVAGCALLGPLDAQCLKRHEDESHLP